MPYRISRHARQQMAARGIPESAVDAVMRSPGQVVDEANGRKCYQSRWSLEQGRLGVPAEADRRR